MVALFHMLHPYTNTENALEAMTDRPNIMLIGRQRPVFHRIVDDLKRWCDCESADSPVTFAAWCADQERNGTLPCMDLIVLLQAFPGEHGLPGPSGPFSVFSRFFPLTPVVVLLDSWCEGECRTGFVPEGIRRVYVHQWSEIAEAEWRMLAAGKTLPVTAGEEEWVLARCRNLPMSVPKTTSRVLVLEEPPFGPDPAMNDLLLEFFLKQGVEAKRGRWIDADAQTTLLVADLADLPDNFSPLRHCRHDFPQMKLSCLVHAPRLEERRQLKRLGVDAILSKPFDLLDLSALLR